ncbi:hypothetical protein J4462_02525 [Candidatus Pacearchaeota archaeon]|nr:hypothetical protein [Candidatus Pacearchaeota archaeon]
MMRDKTHAEFIERWASYVKSVPRKEWKSKLDSFTNAQFEKSLAFYERLKKTEKGRVVLKRLKEERVKAKEY